MVKTVIKLGLLTVGGYFAYDWYKKRNAAKEAGSEALAANPTEAQYENVPLSEQPESVVAGDHLSLTEKESYIIANGRTNVFSGGMLSADGDTDDVVLEAALGEEDGEEGFGAVQSIGNIVKNQYNSTTTSTFASILKLNKCLLGKMKAKFPETDWSAVYKDKVDALYVATKCAKAEAKGEKGCSEIAAVKKAAAKGRKSSEKMRERNPKAVSVILKGCKGGERKHHGMPIVRHNLPNFEEMGFKFNRPTRGNAYNERGSSSANGWDSDNLT